MWTITSTVVFHCKDLYDAERDFLAIAKFLASIQFTLEIRNNVDSFHTVQEVDLTQLQH